ncbi:Hsp70 family protein [Actinoplanes sp. Pm04-4]|uniref:Hsp70 family protein n=1 Tax=Paractinoplanes pyxinae TaxID=2997416 RepID=A0ABT4B2V2_9ACTN|nr:Hsp70 family protein [Actinoplanes pyxinae]MCY1140822.1 Hsp70 family protein [Actinoplanes pyxinae]
MGDAARGLGGRDCTPMTGEERATPGAMRLGISVGSSNTVVVLAEPGRGLRPLLFGGSRLLPSAGPGPERLPVVFAAIAAELQRLGGAVETVVSCPLGWSAGEREALASAAAVAGLGRVQVVPEPQAAAGRLGQTASVLVVDVGAVAADVTLLRRTAVGYEPVAAESIPDAAGEALDAGLTELVRSWVAASGGLPAWERLDRADTPDDENASSKLMLEIVAAKEALSRQESAALFVPLAELGVTVPRVQFEAVATRVFEPVVRAVAGMLADWKEPVTVLLVGGTSRVPVLGQLMAAAAGPYATVPAVPEPELVVAEGCATWLLPITDRREHEPADSEWRVPRQPNAHDRNADWAGRHSAPLPQIEPDASASGRHSVSEPGRHGRPDGEDSGQFGVPSAPGRRRRVEPADDWSIAGGQRQAESTPGLSESGVFPAHGLSDSGVFPGRELSDSGVFEAGSATGRQFAAERSGVVSDAGGLRSADPGVFGPGSAGGRRRAESSGNLSDSGVFRPGAGGGRHGAEPGDVSESGVFRARDLSDSGVYRTDAPGGRRRAEPPGDVSESGVFRARDLSDSGVYRTDAPGGRRRAEPPGDLSESGVFRARDLSDSGVYRTDAPGGRRRAEPSGDLSESGVFGPGAAGGRRQAEPSGDLSESGVFRSGGSGAFRTNPVAGNGRAGSTGEFQSGAVVNGRQAERSGDVSDSGVFRSGNSGVFSTSPVEGDGQAQASGVVRTGNGGGPRPAEASVGMEASGSFRAFTGTMPRIAREAAVASEEADTGPEENKLMVAGLGLLLAGLVWFPVLVVAELSGVTWFVPGVAAAFVGIVLLIAGSGRSKAEVRAKAGGAQGAAGESGVPSRSRAASRSRSSARSRR